MENQQVPEGKVPWNITLRRTVLGGLVSQGLVWFLFLCLGFFGWLVGFFSPLFLVGFVSCFLNLFQFKYSHI